MPVDIIGILSAGFGTKKFLLPNLLLDGGATAYRSCSQKITGVPLSYIIVAGKLTFCLYRPEATWPPIYESK
jgi:hypothetical protein